MATDNGGVQTCVPGSGENKYKYAGLMMYEQQSSVNTYGSIVGYFDVTAQQCALVDSVNGQGATTSLLAYYDAKYWAGIDCSGLVQRSLTRANKANIPGIKSEVQDLGPSMCDLPGQAKCGKDIYSQDFIPSYAYKFNVSGTTATTQAEVLKKVKRGDVVVSKGHIAMVYSDSVQNNGNYEIIHAYGGDCTEYDKNTGLCKIGAFSRKVLTTSNKFKGFPDTKGFGRIKLWD